MVYRLHMCARIGTASLAALARLGGIRVLAYVHRLLYRWVIVVPPIWAVLIDDFIRFTCYMFGIYKQLIRIDDVIA